MWKHGVTAEKQTERDMGDDRLTAGLWEKEEEEILADKEEVCEGDTDPALTTARPTTT